MNKENIIQQKPQGVLEAQLKAVEQIREKQFNLNGLGDSVIVMAEPEIKMHRPEDYDEYVAKLRELKKESRGILIDQLTLPVAEEEAKETNETEIQMPDVTKRLRSPMGLIGHILYSDFPEYTDGIGYDELDDLTQEALIRIYLADQRLTQKQTDGSWIGNTARDPRKMEVGYLAASARHAILRRLDYHRRRPADSLEVKQEEYGFEAPIPVDVEEEVIARISKQEQQAVVLEARKQLTPHQQEVLDALEMGATFQQIGKALGISSAGVQDVLIRSVTKIREIVGVETDLPIQLIKRKRAKETAKNPEGKTNYGCKEQRAKERFQKRYKNNPEFAERVRQRAREYQRRIREAKKAAH